MMFNGGSKGIEEEMGKVFDDAIETLRWARTHYHEPSASVTLRDLEARLGYLAQAMIWQSDGDESEMNQALGLAQGRSIREQDSIRRMWEEMWWSH
jgi:hypothetical protein